MKRKGEKKCTTYFGSHYFTKLTHRWNMVGWKQANKTHMEDYTKSNPNRLDIGSQSVWSSKILFQTPLLTALY